MIGLGKYRVVFVCPELALKPRGRFEKNLWQNNAFVAQLSAVIWDEAHCVKAWSTFRAYKSAGRLRDIIPQQIPYLVASATLPDHLREDVTRILQLRRQRTHVVHLPNDRPNVYLAVRKIRHALSSFKDLEFLIPNNWKPGQRIPTFLVFFDSKSEGIAAAEVLRNRLPLEYRERVVWFNADGTSRFRETATKLLDEGKLFGLMCTDSFGMVSRPILQ